MKNLIRKLALLLPPIRRLSEQRDDLLGQRDALVAERDALVAELNPERISRPIPAAKPVTTEIGDPPREGTWEDLESMAEYWDLCQRLDSFVQLTGSKGPEVWSRLRITDLVTEGAVVLNIGVGFGYCTKALAERGCIVHALDVSPVALERVSDVTEGAWTPDALPSMPSNSVDLAISHLVAQHMNDDDLSFQLCHVLRCLKDSGLFALQMSYPLSSKPGFALRSPSKRYRRLEEKAGSVHRTLPKIADLVEKAGGAITQLHEIDVTPEYGLGWYGIHIVKHFDMT